MRDTDAKDEEVEENHQLATFSYLMQVLDEIEDGSYEVRKEHESKERVEDPQPCLLLIIELIIISHFRIFLIYLL